MEIFMKKLIIFSLLFLFFSCGKNSGDSDQLEFFFEGTVNISGIPTQGVLVNMGYRDTGCQIPSEWRTEKEMRTDENGKYQFKLTHTRAEGFRWRCKAQHPVNGMWTEWKEGGAVTAGGTGTINFHME